MGRYSEPDLKLIFQSYRKDDEHGIDTTVNEVFEGDELRVYHKLGDLRSFKNTEIDIIKSSNLDENKLYFSSMVYRRYLQILR